MTRSPCPVPNHRVRGLWAGRVANESRTYCRTYILRSSRLLSLSSSLLEANLGLRRIGKSSVSVFGFGLFRR